MLESVPPIQVHLRLEQVQHGVKVLGFISKTIHPSQVLQVTPVRQDQRDRRDLQDLQDPQVLLAVTAMVVMVAQVVTVMAITAQAVPMVAVVVQVVLATQAALAEPVVPDMLAAQAEPEVLAVSHFRQIILLFLLLLF